MAITITCHCGKTLQVGDEFAGREGQCPSCGRALQIPTHADNGHITEQAPRPTSRKQESAPWLDPPRNKPMPEPADDDVGNLTTHAGTFITDEEDFFVDAPAEIGKLMSAYTSLKHHQEPTSAVVRTAICLVLFVAGAGVIGIGLVLILGNVRQNDITLLMMLPTAVGVLLAAIGFWWTRFTHTCSYVGTKGCVVYHCTGNRDNVSRTGHFLYEDASELRIGQTRHYYNGVYTGTDYSLTWTNEAGTTIYQFGGRYRSEAGTPGPADPYHYALMAEMAWTMHLFREIERVIASDGALFFGLRGGDFIQLGEGLFILAQGGNKVKLHSDQIEKMTIGNGVISLWEVVKEGWFVNKGIHQFMYADLGNARFFLYALEKLVGIRF